MYTFKDPKITYSFIAATINVHLFRYPNTYAITRVNVREIAAAINVYDYLQYENV